MHSDVIANQWAQLDAHRQTLAINLTQLAILGTGYAPPGVHNGIIEARAAIQHIKAWLRAQGKLVDDAPDDEPTPQETAQTTRQIGEVRQTIASGNNNIQAVDSTITVNRSGDIINAQGSQGFINNPSSPVQQSFNTEYHTHIYNSKGHTLRPRLQAPVGGFVGRSNETNTLEQMLRKASIPDGVAPICVISGMAGVGKTELAQQVASRLRDHFPGGQALISLQSLRETATLTSIQVLQKALRALAPDEPVSDDQAVLSAKYRQHLSDERLLIVVDDALDAKQIRPLLPPAGSALLITTRHRFPLEGSFPLELKQLSGAEAIELLQRDCQRITITQASEIARLCGYLPLALRVSSGLLSANDHLPIEHYLVQFRDERQRLSKLSVSDDEQLDVEASFNLSFALLSEDAQHILAQFSVFEGVFAISAACAVANMLEADIEHCISILRTRNMLDYDATHAHYQLHELIRVFASPKISAALFQIVRHRFTEYYLKEAETSAPDGGEELNRWLRLIGDDYHHFQKILRWIHETNFVSATQALRVVAALGRFWHRRGYLAQGRKELEFILQHPEQDAPATDQFYAAALLWHGAIANDQAQFGIAQTSLRRSLELFTKLNDANGTARAYLNLANALLEDDTQQARLYYAEALRFAGRDDPYLVARIRMNQAFLPSTTLTAYVAKWRKVAADYEQIDDPIGQALSLINFGQYLQLQGELIEARSILRRSLQILEGAIDWRTASAWLHLGWVEVKEGRVQEAIKYFVNSIAVFETEEDTDGMAWNLQGIAAVALEIGKPDLAARLLGHVVKLREEADSLTSWERGQFRELKARVQSQFGSPKAFNQCFNEGKKMGKDLAIALARAFARNPQFEPQN